MLIFRLCLYLPTSAATQARPMRCNQSETRMLFSDWLQLTGLAWVATEVDKYKRSVNILSQFLADKKQI